MDITTNFIAGRMNKSVDERLIPPGEYKNALNVRLGSTETTDIGAVENSKGNTKLTTVEYDGNPLSTNATCIGAYADAIREQMYWFIHDNNPNGTTVNLIVSYNTVSQLLTYHVVSVSVLNFNPKYLITGVQLVEDLLFFTDNYNPPRVININTAYPTPTGLNDNFTEEDISLIVKPPGYHSYVNTFGQTVFDLAAPSVTLYKTASQEENFLSDRFISFAYRYRYEDKQYSATSLFTLAAFDTLDFNIEPEAMINEGMENRANSAQIQYSTGSEKVKEIQLLYKESSSNVIYIVETFIKADLGWGDNDIKTFTFTSNKVYGTLGSDELLRQFDNVPLLAKALTVQGNRVMLGNYTEGYDITTLNGQPIPIDFETSLSTQQVSTGVINAPFTYATSTGTNTTVCYTVAGPIIPPPYSTCSTYSRAMFDLSNVPLPVLQGIEFVFQMQIYAFETTGFNGSALNPNERYVVGTATQPITLTLNYTAPQQFNSISEMLSHDSFRTAVGEYVDPTTAIANASTGGTLMDQFNRIMLEQVSNVTIANGFNDDYEFVFESISSSASNQVLQYTGPIPSTSGGSGVDNCFGIVFPATRFDPISMTPGFNSIFNYYRFVLEDVQSGNPNPYTPLFSSYSLRPVIQSSGLVIDQTFNNRSLHSNRDYEAGIVYMDGFGRATTALVCPTNTVFIPCENSITANRINVSVNNKPPFWAKKYKFVLKQSRGTYDTIYIRRFYQDTNDTSLYWFALEGEDKALVNEGDQLIVKRDVSGPLDQLAVATVLEVEPKIRGELLTDISLSGLYMCIKPNNFNVREELDEFGVPVQNSINFGQNPGNVSEDNVGKDPFFNYPVPQIYNPLTDEYDLAEVAQGAVIKINFRIWRTEWDPWLGIKDESIDWRWSQSFVSPVKYDNFYEWWKGENIISFAQGSSNDGQIQLFTPIDVLHGPPSAPFINGVGQNGPIEEGIPISGIPGFGAKYAFYEAVGQTGEVRKRYFLQLRANVNQGGSLVDKRPCHVDMSIEFYSQDNLLIFETSPPDADPNLFFDSSEMYDIKEDINGDLSHAGEIQNQVVSANVPAISQLPHFNCFTYYNGAESYKIEDAATGKALALGQRTTAISTEPYAKQERKASITYSGIYYPSSGINNSNEFNLGLANFKDLETNFGPVMKLHARETDILCLQEDRISYVLLGKNLISDSVGGGAIVSVPEVLGQQIARIEEYGISFNPESFTSWGNNMYFSDTKRAAIIQLSGGSIKTDTLNVISDKGMRSYFRDKFISQLNTQKLGGYDPYMDEYVFSTNTTEIPIDNVVSPCGRVLTPSETSSSYSISIEVGAVVGDFNIGYNVLSPSTATLDIVAIFNGVTTSVSSVSGVGNLKVQKTSVYPTTVDITVLPSEECSYTITPACITSRAITQVTQFVLVQSGGGKFHYGYSWTDGVFDSPIDEELAIIELAGDRECFAASGILSTKVNSGIASSGLIPYGGTTIKMFVDKKPGDTYIWNPARGHKLYAYTQKQLVSGCNEILADLTNKTPLTVTNVSGDKYQGKLENLKLTGTTFSGTNASTAPANYIADLSVNFIDEQISVGDSVTSSAGVVGTVLSVAANLVQTGVSGVPTTIVFQNEGYTIRRSNLNQVVLVYDMRKKVGNTVCEDTVQATACNCSGVCTPFISSTNPASSYLNACLQQLPGQGNTLIGVAHSGATPLPIIGNTVYRTAACDPTNLLADGYYWMQDQFANNSNEVMQVVNGICVGRQTINC